MLAAEYFSTQAEVTVRRKSKKGISDDLTTLEEFFLKSSPEEILKCNIFHVLLDSVISNITTRFDASKYIISLFSILWLVHG